MNTLQQIQGDIQQIRQDQQLNQNQTNQDLTTIRNDVQQIHTNMQTFRSKVQRNNQASQVNTYFTFLLIGFYIGSTMPSPASKTLLPEEETLVLLHFVHMQPMLPFQDSQLHRLTLRE